MLDIPDVRNALAVGPLEAVGRWADDFHHDEGTFPRGRELVHSLGALDMTLNPLTHVEGSLPHVAVMMSHLIFQRKPNASHMCARIKFTHI
jgi:hypothetical protein